MCLLMCFFVTVIPDPQQDIHRYHTGVNDIEDKRQVIVFRQDLRADSAEVPDQNETAEQDAFASGCSGGPHFADR